MRHFVKNSFIATICLAITATDSNAQNNGQIVQPGNYIHSQGLANGQGLRQTILTLRPNGTFYYRVVISHSQYGAFRPSDEVEGSWQVQGDSIFACYPTDGCRNFPYDFNGKILEIELDPSSGPLPFWRE